MKHFNFIILLGVFFLGVFFQSCSKDETAIALEEKIDDLSQDKDFVNFLSEFGSYKNNIFTTIETLDDDEKERLFNNLNNDDFMMSFMKKYNLIEDNIALQRATLSLEQNQDWSSLNNIEKNTLFAKNVSVDKSIHTTFPRLKLRSETGNSECQKIFDRELSKAYGIAMLELIGCTCAIEAPPIACLCYVAVMARYYSTIDTLEREKQECELRNN
ncbi:MAG: hypothetical protein GXZ19_04925 [Bacteroidales bacterium]|nr:hypothetical protein [Bacteroidales bacterium]